MYKPGSSFFEEVYQIVSNIPEGSVMTYGMIATMLGRPRAARIVGYAMHDAPSDRQLPCHRVVNREGRLSPDGIFGEGVQRRILEAEGITFKENGCIDMDKHLTTWLP
jgi:methylated-DNA-protein-cysteine methyltransferase-like protein